MSFDFQQLEDILNSPLPTRENLISCLDEAIFVLKIEEDSNYRKGGLLDFLKPDENEKKPVLVVPDIHGRDYFLIDILKHEIDCGEKISVFDALQQEKIFVVCVGDAMHGELRAIDRWKKAYFEYRFGNSTGEAMKEEMRENLSVLQICCKLKANFPKNFHFLKGNHENILNNSEDGNRSFRKFCDEGYMTRDFIIDFYDDATLNLIDLYEKSLPLVAIFKNCAVSHAEPAETFTRKELENYKKSLDITEKVVFGLTWTQNDSVFENTIEKTEKNLYKKAYNENIVWFGGHRPVEEKYALRQNGKYIQIHNPYEENFVFVNPDRAFNPKTDIISL